MSRPTPVVHHPFLTQDPGTSPSTTQPFNKMVGELRATGVCANPTLLAQQHQPTQNHEARAPARAGREQNRGQGFVAKIWRALSWGNSCTGSSGDDDTDTEQSAPTISWPTNFSHNVHIAVTDVLRQPRGLTHWHHFISLLNAVDAGDVPKVLSILSSCSTAPPPQFQSSFEIQSARTKQQAQQQQHQPCSSSEMFSPVPSLADLVNRTCAYSRAGERFEEWSALHTAASKNTREHAEIIQILVEHGAVVDLRTVPTTNAFSGRTALHIACQHNCNHTAHCLLRLNANPNTPLCDAQTLWKSSNSSSQPNRSYSNNNRRRSNAHNPSTASNNHEDNENQTNNTNANTSINDDDDNSDNDNDADANNTFATTATSWSVHDDEPASVFVFGRTCLHVAAQNGNNKLVRALLAHGADPMAIQGERRLGGSGAVRWVETTETALHIATRRGHTQAVATLALHISRQADSGSHTANSVSASRSHVSRGVDCQSVYRHGYWGRRVTALQLACERNDLGTALVLVRAGADLYQSNSEGQRISSLCQNREFFRALAKEHCFQTRTRFIWLSHKQPSESPVGGDIASTNNNSAAADSCSLEVLPTDAVLLISKIATQQYVAEHYFDLFGGEPVF